jgi:hypothetical protein
MISLRNALTATCLGLALIAAGCGGGGGDGDGDDAENSYLPLSVGNSWDYQMTLAPDVVPAQAGDNQLFDYHETVTGTETHDDVRYFIIEARRDATDEYPERVVNQIRRVDEEAVHTRLPLLDETGEFIVDWYDAPYLKLPPREGETWTDPQYEDLAFTTAAIEDQITVPAGTFSCVRVEQQWEAPAEQGEGTVQHTIKQWYAQGVGVVRDQTWEDDAMTSTIELTDYTVN